MNTPHPDDTKSLVKLWRADGIGGVSMVRGPSNLLTFAMISALAEGIETLESDPTVGAIVVSSQGRVFSKGMPEAALAREYTAGDTGLSDLCLRIGRCSKPVVAAISGTAMSEGVALALSAHLRVMGPHGRFVFSDASYGMIAGGGLTQRLPRLVGAPQALELLHTGAIVGPKRAEALGLVHEVTTENPGPTARRLAQKLAQGDAPDIAKNWRGWPDEAGDVVPFSAAFAAIASARKAHNKKSLPLDRALIDCIDAALVLPYEAGVAREAVSRADCYGSAHGAALRHAFFAERRAGQPKAKPETAPEVSRLGLCGGDTVAIGLAMTALDRGVEVQFCAPDREAAREIKAKINAAYEAARIRGALSDAQSKARLQRFAISASPADLVSCDVVIEATTGPLPDRIAALVDVEKVLPASVALATVSDHAFDEMAAQLRHKNRFVAAHVFAPSQVVRVVELARGAETDDASYAAVHRAINRLGKTAVTLRPHDGLIANTVQNAGLAAVDVLLLLGARPAQIDAALRGFGFALGPCAMMDSVGLQHFNGSVVRMIASTSLGGFFDDTGADTASNAILDQMREAANLTATALTDAEIVGRFVLAQANAGARLIESGVVDQAEDIDVVMLLAKGFPRHQGGPMQWADCITPLHAQKTLENYATAAPDIWAPTSLWAELVKSGSLLNPRD